MQPGAFDARYGDDDHGRPKVFLRGELDMSTVNEAEEVLLKTVASATKGEVTVDVTLLTFIDGSGARALIAAHNAAATTGRKIRIVGAHGLVATVLAILELIDLQPGWSAPHQGIGRDTGGRRQV
jgi:anti-anti-sigma factor